VAPVVIRPSGEAATLRFRRSGGLGGRSTPKPAESRDRLLPGDRLLLVSDGVVDGGAGQVALGLEGLLAAAARSEQSSASDTVREVHRAVLAASAGELRDDATAVCLLTG
jgi:serine phosphatase RsbU (regulator of sigma subunit)